MEIEGTAGKNKDKVLKTPSIQRRVRNSWQSGLVALKPIYASGTKFRFGQTIFLALTLTPSAFLQHNKAQSWFHPEKKI